MIAQREPLRQLPHRNKTEAGKAKRGELPGLPLFFSGPWARTAGRGRHIPPRDSAKRATGQRRRNDGHFDIISSAHARAHAWSPSRKYDPLITPGSPTLYQSTHFLLSYYRRGWLGGVGLVPSVSVIASPRPLFHARSVPQAACWSRQCPGYLR